MVGKRSVTIVTAATLLFGGGASAAFASEDHDTLPGSDTALVRVTVPDQAAVDSLVDRYDLAEYKNVEDDGSISLNIETDAAERAELRDMGFKIGRTVEDAKTRASTAEERDQTARRRRAWPRDLARKRPAA